MKNNNNQGLAALISILTISAIALAISVSISLQSIDNAKVLVGSKSSQKTLKIAEGCVEEAILRIKRDDFTSPISLNIGDGSCVITIPAPVGNLYAVTVVATLTETGNDYIKSITSNIEKAGDSVVQIDWQEI